MSISRDLDRYLSKRKSPSTFSMKFDTSDDDSWLSGFFNKKTKDEVPEDELSLDEKEKLEMMEEDIKESEEEIEKVHEFEEELEEEQEERVGLYHQLLGMFKRSDKEELEDDDDEVVVFETDEVKDDFRILAAIQLKWFERLPLRHKMAFKDSDDYKQYVAILERRGVARKR
ncbi:hypothetical protein GOV11_00675 [Candidatus Woesearchaeota archaeon]|nr:hypothetical protein [Candidatus Woesearchaeota archaeon]